MNIFIKAINNFFNQGFDLLTGEQYEEMVLNYYVKYISNVITSTTSKIKEGALPSDLVIDLPSTLSKIDTSLKLILHSRVMERSWVLIENTDEQKNFTHYSIKPLRLDNFYVVNNTSKKKKSNKKNK